MQRPLATCVCNIFYGPLLQASKQTVSWQTVQNGKIQTKWSIILKMFKQNSSIIVMKDVCDTTEKSSAFLTARFSLEIPHKDEVG